MVHVKYRLFYWLLIVTLFSGCASVAVLDLGSLYGPAKPRERVIEQLPAGDIDYWTQAKPILDNRCSVCHACYDAPCQLTTSSIEGIIRGGSKQKVYRQSRLKPAPPSRLFEDAQSLEDWRNKGFYPVLNEHANIAEANREASLIYNMLELKKHNSLPDDKLLSSRFDLSLNRKNMCPTAEEFPQYASSNPLAGMPYGLPGLKPKERSTLMRWVEEGGRYTPRAALSQKYRQRIDRWEAYFNGDSDRKQLASRYMYEHLFIAHLYFDDLLEDGQQPIFFKLVRSSTPPGEPINIIASRRPYDAPGVDRVYYRLQQEPASIVAKTHMPYALSENRMQRWKSLFDDVEFSVNELPGYEQQRSSNPFLTFNQLPVKSRYKFMLDEAQFTIMGFIKGPVCRGQVALSVINDNFWVFFVTPDAPGYKKAAKFLETHSDKLEIPAAKSSTVYLAGKAWRYYAKRQKSLLEEKNDFLRNNISVNNPISLDDLWDGDGNNPNASLTVFRHVDSATVMKGLIGEPPKTAWVIGYTLLERIHYLLVAGYDVYGNAGHQLITRAYMDFLRIEGEAHFLAFLPKEARDRERNHWYRDAKSDTKEFVTLSVYEDDLHSNIEYQSSNEKLELYKLLAQRLAKVLPGSQNSNSPMEISMQQQLSAVSTLDPEAVAMLPQVAVVQITDQGRRHYFTLLHHNEYSSVTSLLSEDKYRLPEEDEVVFIPGIVGSYPNAFYRLDKTELPEFIDALSKLDDKDSYSLFLDRYGMRRTNPEFWAFSDQVHNDYRKMNPVEFGLLDYNRLENR